MGILGPWSSLNINNFVWLIQDGARSHCKIGSEARSRQKRIPDPRSRMEQQPTLMYFACSSMFFVLLCFAIPHQLRFSRKLYERRSRFGFATELDFALHVQVNVRWAAEEEKDTITQQVRIRNGIRFCFTCTGQCTLGCRRRKG